MGMPILHIFFLYYFNYVKDLILKTVMNIDLVVPDLTPLMTEGWRNVRDAESTGYSCALGGETGREWVGKGGEGLRAPRSAQPLTGSASSRRCAAALITGGGGPSTPTPCVYSPRDLSDSADVCLAQEGHPPSLWTVNRRHLTVRHGTHHGRRSASSVFGVCAPKAGVLMSGTYPRRARLFHLEISNPASGESRKRSSSISVSSLSPGWEQGRGPRGSVMIYRCHSWTQTTWGQL